MLIDDNPDDNFFHERAIKKNNLASIVITKNSAKEALELLTTNKGNNELHPDLIFLDINMPGMNGWDFLHEYNLLDKKMQSRAIIVMLTTSENPDDLARAKSCPFVTDYITKPLTKEIMGNIIGKYFE